MIIEKRIDPDWSEGGEAVKEKGASSIVVIAIIVIIVAAVGVGSYFLLKGRPSGAPTGFRDSFPVNKNNLGPTGNNPYFILKPGYKLSYEAGDSTFTTTVLNETKIVDNVETRVIQDIEESNGQLVEITYDYFAIDKTTNDVYYFGEDVDIYKNGKVFSHEGAWLSGVNDAKFGLIMPGQIKVGDKFYQELAPNIAMDRAEVVGINDEVETPAGTFKNCIHFAESSAIDTSTASKWYARDVGLVQDDEFVLVKIENN